MALELENALEWSNGVGTVAGGMKSASSCDTSRYAVSSDGMRHFIALLRSGRHLPAIVRLKRISDSSLSTPETDVPDKTIFDESNCAQYVSFCRFSASARRDTSDAGSLPTTSQKTDGDTMLIWVTAVMSQLRAAFRTNDSRFLTVPADTSYKFYVISRAGRSHSAISPSASLTLRDALEKCASAENSRQVSLVIDADDVVEKLGCKRLGQLRFLGFFSAEYLVGRQITVHQTGELGLADVVCVPVNAPVTLDVAIGLQRQPTIEFRQLKETLIKVNDTLTSCTETHDVRMPCVISPTILSTTTLELDDLKYVEPAFQLPAVPPSASSPPPLADDAVARKVEPPPRRKNATANRTSCHADASPADDKRSSASDSSCHRSSTHVIDQRSPASAVRSTSACSPPTSSPNGQFPLSGGILNSLTAENSERLDRLRSSSCSTGSTGSSAAFEVDQRSNCIRTSNGGAGVKLNISSSSASLSNHVLPIISHHKSTSGPPVHVTDTSIADCSSVLLRESASRTVKFTWQHSDDDESHCSLPVVMRPDRVSHLITSVSRLQRDAKSLPGSPEIGRFGKGMQTSSMRSTNSAVGDDKPTGIEDLLRTSTNVNGKVTIRAAQVERRPSPSKLHLSTLWNPAAEDGLNTAQSSATNADDVKAEKPDACDLRSNVGESSKADDAGVRLQRRITNSTATVVNVTDLTKTKGQGEPVTVSREDSPTCNTYLRLLPDDYFEPSGDQLSKTALSPHTATSDNVAVDLKRSLSGSLENNGNRLTKNRPLSASMHNLVRPLPEVPKPTNIRHCSSSRHAAPSGGRRQTPASINNRPVRPFKKLLNFVSKQQQKYRRSAGDRTADSWSTSDADEHTNELDKIETITQVFGEENLYEPLRRPTNNNSSSCVRCQCQMRSTCSTCECVETRRECDDVSKVGGGGGGGINRWTVASDIPPNVQRFTINEVADCLRLLKMEKYVTPFAEQDVDGALLVTMDEDLLQDSFGMTGLEAKKIVEFAKNGWRPRT